MKQKWRVPALHGVSVLRNIVELCNWFRKLVQRTLNQSKQTYGFFFNNQAKAFVICEDMFSRASRCPQHCRIFASRSDWFAALFTNSFSFSSANEHHDGQTQTEDLGKERDFYFFALPRPIARRKRVGSERVTHTRTCKVSGKLSEILRVICLIWNHKYDFWPKLHHTKFNSHLFYVHFEIVRFNHPVQDFIKQIKNVV